MMRQRHLIVFAKEPRIGRVKTRLGRDIGAVWAWRFYRQTLIRIYRRLSRDRRWQTWLYVAPDSALTRSGAWPQRARLRRQGQGDLGSRMQRALHTMPPGPVVLIGADIPGIEASHIADAFKALGQADMVFGPAWDGGFWLVGVSGRRRSDLFKGVDWARPETLRQTLAGLAPNVTARLVQTLADVDDGAGYAAAADSIRRASSEPRARRKSQSQFG